MSDDKRMVGSYEVKNALHIGGKEIIFAEDLTAKEPYMVCECRWDNPLGMDIYENAFACAGYLEAITEFLDCAASEVQHVRDQRGERGVSDEPLTAMDCIPDSKYHNFENQLVVIRPERMIGSARTADKQLFVAVSGFGCDPDARGRAVFCQNVYSGETVRWNRQDVAGILLPAKIPQWAYPRLEEMGVAIQRPEPPKVYMGSMDEARQKNELEAFRKSWSLNQACAISIQDAIQNSHKGNYSYDLPAALKAVTTEFGAERVQMVLANTVQYKEGDGRFSHENREWAQTIPLPQMAKTRLADFVCETHSALLDGFVSTVRKEQQEKKPSVMDRLKAPSPKAPPKPKKTPQKGQER